MKNTKWSPITKGNVFVGLATICLSLKPILIKLVYAEGMDPETTLFIRQMMATLILWGLVLFSKSKPSFPRNRKNIVKLLLIGLFGFFISPLLDFWGLFYVDAIVERMLLFTYPIFVILMTSVLSKKPIDLTTIVTTLSIYVGIMLTLGGNELSSLKVNLFGAVCILLAAITYAYYLVLSGELVHSIGTVKLNAAGMLVATVSITLYLLVKILVADPVPLFSYSGKSYFLLLLISLITTVVPLLLMVEGMKRIGVIRSSMISLFGPMITIILGTFYLKESLEPVQWFGCFLVLVSVVLLEGKKYFSRENSNSV